MTRLQDDAALYGRMYDDPAYRMGDVRREEAGAVLATLPRGSFLDVGTGRGEFLKVARGLGFAPVFGTELVPALCVGSVVNAPITALPFESASFDVVTCLDVLEHIDPNDTKAALAELARVANRFAVISVANFSDVWHGVELHINIRDYSEWGALFSEAFGTAQRAPSALPIWVCEK